MENLANKSNSWSVTKQQINGLNTEAWKIKKGTVHIKSSTESVFVMIEAFCPLNANRKTWLKRVMRLKYKA